LLKINLRYQDIAIPVFEFVWIRTIEIHVLAQDSLLIDSLVVNSNLVLSHIVIDNHFSRANYDYLTYFLRIEPANVDVSNDLFGIHDIEKHHIIDSLLNKIHTNPVYRKRRGVSQPVLDDADIVRRKIPQCVDIGPNTAKIKPLTVDIPN